MKRRPRQIDVARVAGVSPATVSLVLNDRLGGNVRISPETRQRVLDVAAELGYVADPVARSLAGGDNRLLGVFTYEAIFPIKTQDFYYRFLVGIEEEAEVRGYDLLLFTSARGPDGVRSIYRRRTNRLWMADGSVLLGVEHDKTELVRLVQEGCPFVYVGRREAPGVEISYVAADYTAATAEIVTYMLGYGHTTIAYLGQVNRTEAQIDRYIGYTETLQRNGIPINPKLVWYGGSEEINRELFTELLSSGATAFLVEHIHSALRLLDVAAALGLQVPDDFSLATLGDPLTYVEAPVPLTTFKIPRRRMGAEAVRLLIDIMHAPQSTVQRCTLPCEFVEGRTVAAPPEQN